MSRRATTLIVLAITLTILFTVSGCATVRQQYALTSGDSYMMPHELQLAKRELRRVVQTETREGRWVELVVNIHCYTNTRIDYCVSLGEFFNFHFEPVGFTRVHWDLVPWSSLTGDTTDIHWDVVPLVHDQ